MILPAIRRSLRRADLTRLVDEIARGDPAAGPPAAAALRNGDIDELLDAPAALDAVRGRGGAPGALPLPLLWYVPVRAALRSLGERDVDLADFAASVPLAFVRAGGTPTGGRGPGGMVAWERSIRALPPGTTVRAERAGDCGALAMWWAACFPEAVTGRGGRGMIRAYLAFAGMALREVGEALAERRPAVARLYARAAERIELLHRALRATSVDYIGPDAHTADGRTRRYLARLGGALC